MQRSTLEGRRPQTGPVALGDRETLGSLLALWRETKNAEVARAIEAVSRRITRFLPPIALGQKKEAHARWMKVASAGDPCDLGRLLDHAAVRLAGGAIPSIARVRDLAKWAIDPRIARFLCDLLADPPGGLHHLSEHWEAAIEIVVRTGDPRSIRDLERVWGRASAALLDEALVRLRRVPTKELDDVTAARVAAIVQETDDERIEREHLEAIAASPDDDDVRLVYADWLQSKGDPRGEFIALQCAIAKGNQDDRAHERARKLLVRHREVWLGDVARIIDRRRAVFARGFLDTCRTHPSFAQSSLLLSIARDRRWWTLRSLSLEAQGLVDQILVRHIDARALRRLVTAPAVLGSMEGRVFPRVRTLVVSSGFDDTTRRVVAEGAPFPALEKLAICDRASTIDWLFDAPITHRLACVSVEARDFGSLALTASRFPRELPQVELVTSSARFVFRRDEDGELTRCEMRAPADSRAAIVSLLPRWIEALATLPGGLRRFAMLCRGPLTEDEHERLRGVLSTYRRLESCELPAPHVVYAEPPPLEHERFGRYD